MDCIFFWHHSLITSWSLRFSPVFVFPSEFCIIDCKDLSTRDLIGLTDVYLMFGESGISELKLWCKLKSCPPGTWFVGWIVLWCIVDEGKIILQFLLSHRHDVRSFLRFFFHPWLTIELHQFIKRILASFCQQGIDKLWKASQNWLSVNVKKGYHNLISPLSSWRGFPLKETLYVRDPVKIRTVWGISVRRAAGEDNRVWVEIPTEFLKQLSKASWF